MPRSTWRDLKICVLYLEKLLAKTALRSQVG